MSIGMVSEGANVASMCDSNDVRGRLELEMIMNKR